MRLVIPDIIIVEREREREMVVVVAVQLVCKQETGQILWVEEKKREKKKAQVPLSLDHVWTQEMRQRREGEAQRDG